MTREWKPGDVALVRNEYGVWNRAILQVQPDENRWVYGVAYNAASMECPARPLVVIDSEDREQVERLVSHFFAHIGERNPNVRAQDDAMQAALRSLIAPPEPEEPTGNFARVLNGEGATYYRSPAGIWRRERDDLGRPWDHIGAVRVLSEGVTDD